MGVENTKFSEDLIKISFFDSIKNKIKKTVSGSRNSFILLDSGEVYVFGDNSEGQSTGLATRYSTPTKLNFDFEENDKIVDIEVGHNHCFVTTQSKKLYSWGSASDGKLGNNETNQFSYFAKPVAKIIGKKVGVIYLGQSVSLITIN